MPRKPNVPWWLGLTKVSMVLYSRISSAADDKWLLIESFVVVLLIFMTLVDTGKLIIESI